MSLEPELLYSYDPKEKAQALARLVARTRFHRHPRSSEWYVKCRRGTRVFVTEAFKFSGHVTWQIPTAKDASCHGPPAVPQLIEPMSYAMGPRSHLCRRGSQHVQHLRSVRALHVCACTPLKSNPALSRGITMRRPVERESCFRIVQVTQCAPLPRAFLEDAALYGLRSGRASGNFARAVAVKVRGVSNPRSITHTHTRMPDNESESGPQGHNVI